MTKYYYNLEEILGIQDKGPYGLGLATDAGLATIMNFIIGNINTTQSKNYSSLPAFAFSGTKTLFNDYIYPIYYHENILSLNEEPANILQCIDLVPLYGHIYEWLKSTSDTYGKLITYWTSIENNLMKSIEASSISKFNDTPQGSGDYSGDTYTTTVTKLSTLNDGGTTMQRFLEIRNNIVNIYEMWAKDFGSTFVLWSTDYEE